MILPSTIHVAKGAPGKRVGVIILCLLLTGCRSLPERRVDERRGEEIVAAGRFFPADTRVVNWLDAGGYNLYLPPPAAPKNHEPRRALAGVTSRRGEWQRLRSVVDQLVVHYDNTGSSAVTFGVLQRRGLSAHFLIDVDGTIYQTLDLRERGWHATIANERSIGVEIAQIGAYPPAEGATLSRWYEPDPAGGVRVKTTRPGAFRPMRPDSIRGEIQGRDLIQYDFTSEQYTALAHLAAALNRVFPKIRLDAPRDTNGQIPARKLDDKTYTTFTGLLGHYHIQENKIDPGPAFQWEKLILDARNLCDAKD